MFAAARSGLALIWKIVLVVELLGRSNGVGFQIEIYFQLFDVTMILAYTLAFILVVQTIEWAALQPGPARHTGGSGGAYHTRWPVMRSTACTPPGAGVS